MLKAGVPPNVPMEKATKKNPSVVKGGYRFSGNIDEIFEKFFGTSNPFTITTDAKGKQITSVLEVHESQKGTDLEVTVPCTLEEFFFGCQKEIQFDRTERVDHRGNERTLTIARMVEVKPGMGAKPGKEDVRYPGEGHLKFAQVAGDLIVKFTQIPHSNFKRHGNDLIYYHKISLVEALRSQPIRFVTIENETLEIALDEVIDQHSEKIILGKGMPIINENPLGPIKRDFNRGNLIVRFDI